MIISFQVLESDGQLNYHQYQIQTTQNKWKIKISITLSGESFQKTIEEAISMKSLN